MKEAAHQPPKKVKRKIRLKVSKEVAILCSCCAAIVLLSLSLFNTSFFLSGGRVLGASQQGASGNEIIFWQDLVAKYPNYLQGWLELAQLEIEAGNKTAAATYLDKASRIDPNSSQVKEIQKLLVPTP